MTTALALQLGVILGATILFLAAAVIAHVERRRR